MGDERITEEAAMPLLRHSGARLQPLDKGLIPRARSQAPSFGPLGPGDRDPKSVEGFEIRR